MYKSSITLQIVTNDSLHSILMQNPKYCFRDILVPRRESEKLIIAHACQTRTCDRKWRGLRRPMLVTSTYSPRSHTVGYFQMTKTLEDGDFVDDSSDEELSFGSESSDNDWPPPSTYNVCKIYLCMEVLLCVFPRYRGTRYRHKAVSSYV